MCRPVAAHGFFLGCVQAVMTNSVLHVDQSFEDNPMSSNNMAKRNHLNSCVIQSNFQCGGKKHGSSEIKHLSLSKTPPRTPAQNCDDSLNESLTSMDLLKYHRQHDNRSANTRLECKPSGLPVLIRSVINVPLKCYQRTIERY